MTNEERLAKKRAYMKVYRETHKDVIQNWRDTHREEVLAYKKEYRKTHKKQISDYRNAHKNEARILKRKSAMVAYEKAKNNVSTDMYQFSADAEVIITDTKHIRFNDRNYCIIGRGYLHSREKYFHVEYAKRLGIWFDGCNVHHIDCNPLNNTKENLIALTVEEHRYAHELLKESENTYYDWINKKKVVC